MTVLEEEKRSKKVEQSMTFISGLQVGIANMADSLAAIKKLVYEEKKITKEQLWNAILDDSSQKRTRRFRKCSLMTFQNTEMMMTMSIS
mgnify:CR=1 FL=1